MVPNVAPTTLAMPRTNRVNVNVTSVGRCRAMQNDSGQFTHNCGSIGFVFNKKHADIGFDFRNLE
jgi:hypothetical protein